MCALAAEISARIIQRRRHRAFSVRVDAAFANATALACLSEGRDVSSDPLAWSVGAIAPDFHAVTVIDDEYLFDATSFQFSRPQHGLVVPAPLVVAFGGNGVEFDLPDGGYGAYKRQIEQRQFNPDLLTELRAPAVRRFVELWSRAG